MIELAEIDKRIAQLEGIDGNNTKSRKRMTEVNHDLLEETGWAYSDIDDMEGHIYMDGFGRTYYLPDGYRVSNDEDD